MSSLWLGRQALPAMVLLAGTGAASADCVRHVYNRSPLVLVGTQDGGPSFTIRPGSSHAVRLAGPGSLDLSGYCAGFGRWDEAAPAGAPVARASLRYTAVLDRCHVEIGHDFFDAELGRGFLPREGTQPFTANAPRQGDVVLYTERTLCDRP